MEINITEFANAGAFKYSHSVAEGGQSAGRDTWDAARASGLVLLKTPEQRDAFNKHMRGMGFSEDVAAMSEEDANGLFVQLISGDIREAGADSLDEIEWDDYEERSRAGQISGNLFKSDKGEYYYTLSC